MSKLIYYTPGKFNTIADYPGVRTFLSLFKIFNHNISFADRTGTLQAPIKVAIPNKVKLPDFEPTFNLTLEECAINRATEIYNKHKELNVPIRVSWSGGIDSSVALMSFIEALGISEAKNCLEVSMSAEGIIENPYLWEKIIRPNNFKIVNSLLVTNEWTGNVIMVNGEGGDQVQGTDIYRGLIKEWGANAIVMPWTSGLIIDFILRRDPTLEKVKAEFLASKLIEIVKKSPVEILTHGDFWWWLNFAAKWSSTFYRLMTKAPPGVLSDEFVDNYFFPFYNSNDFQQWSVYKREEKHKGTWTTYKWKAKEFVAKASNSPEYGLKHRQGSLYNVLAHTTRVEAIDENFQLYSTINPIDWYEPTNSFKM